MRTATFSLSIFLALAFVSVVRGDANSSGPYGVNGLGLLLPNGTPLTGAGIAIGMVEGDAPADPDFPHPEFGFLGNDHVDPAGVYEIDGPNGYIAVPELPLAVFQHPMRVAGTMISTDDTDPDGPTGPLFAPIGLSPGADLHASALISETNDYTKMALQHVATRAGGDVRAINMSFGFYTGSSLHPDLTGNAQETLFLDWSATAHDVLYVAAAHERFAGGDFPDSSFNALLVGWSTRDTNGVFNMVHSDNRYHTDDWRTFVDLVAPGDSITAPNYGNFDEELTGNFNGTSAAAPHATSAVALIQEFVEYQIGVSAPRWGANARRHEVSKAVLMNSADKLEDNGAFAPVGALMGMERTLLDQNGDNWLASEAYGDGYDDFGMFQPLDDQMGAGHLNVRRALQQISSGEYEADSGDVPLIGWDYGTTTGAGQVRKYRFDEELTEDYFLSVTLAWDRHVDFAPGGDSGIAGQFDEGDTFAEYMEEGDFFGDPQADDVINDLDIYLMPRGAFSKSQAIALATGDADTIEHLFFQIPMTGDYEIWVEQFDADQGSQDYALAWWAASPNVILLAGDFDGDGIVTAADLTQWESDYGLTAGSDANGDGVSNGLDFLAWQKTLGNSAAVSNAATVPEPRTLSITLFGLVVLSSYSRRQVQAA